MLVFGIFEIDKRKEIMEKKIAEILRNYSNEISQVYDKIFGNF